MRARRCKPSTNRIDLENKGIRRRRPGSRQHGSSLIRSAVHQRGRPPGREQVCCRRESPRRNGPRSDYPPRRLRQGINPRARSAEAPDAPRGRVLLARRSRLFARSRRRSRARAAHPRSCARAPRRDRRSPRRSRGHPRRLRLAGAIDDRTTGPAARSSSSRPAISSIAATASAPSSISSTASPTRPRPRAAR